MTCPYPVAPVGHGYSGASAGPGVTGRISSSTYMRLRQNETTPAIAVPSATSLLKGVPAIRSLSTLRTARPF
jgi:hypothetical protein